MTSVFAAFDFWLEDLLVDRVFPALLTLRVGLQFLDLLIESPPIKFIIADWRVTEAGG
ncbi:hypothetical protein MPC44_002972 [Listeria monocytogenes]|uniref:hypothetical protein n=1 Tax=Listeria TaxID=1637 RepID=UPI00074D5481|nr:hypothetical protein [Listeria monocytogenes]EIM5113347.1 hypothetical protein [Listeria monocytogenes]EIN1009091.1 hypothetical protein [Listeria monocytogenes]EIZ3191251.1 hypothetical protein [Listeria monocytogenes]EIZ3443497.1 hypothetical protein [Listeria monocytogenes]RKB60526.1 hypothetical protein HL35_03066 [Listeria monocytogenes]